MGSFAADAIIKSVAIVADVIPGYFVVTIRTGPDHTKLRATARGLEMLRNAATEYLNLAIAAKEPAHA